MHPAFRVQERQLLDVAARIGGVLLRELEAVRSRAVLDLLESYRILLTFPNSFRNIADIFRTTKTNISGPMVKVSVELVNGVTIEGDASVNSLIVWDKGMDIDINVIIIRVVK